jgi:hypothetical protein
MLSLEEVYSRMTNISSQTEDPDILGLVAAFLKFKEAYTKFNDDKKNVDNWKTAAAAKDSFNKLYNSKFTDKSFQALMRLAGHSNEFYEIESENPYYKQKGGKKRRTTHRKSLKKSNSKRLNKLFKRSKRSKRSKTRKHYM